MHLPQSDGCSFLGLDGAESRQAAPCWAIDKPTADDCPQLAALLFAVVRCLGASFATLSEPRSGRPESEVLGKRKLSDGGPFRAGDSPRSKPPVPEIDREAHRRVPETERIFLHFRRPRLPASILESTNCYSNRHLDCNCKAGSWSLAVMC